VLKHLDVARLGERAVVQKYVDDGFEIIETNWRLGVIGEVDVIVQKDSTLVFCEVKSRTSIRFGYPEEAVGQNKLKRLKALSSAWCSLADCRNLSVRLDVAAVQIQGGKVSEITVFEDVTS
jgi:putative endonuclease